MRTWVEKLAKTIKTEGSSIYSIDLKQRGIRIINYIVNLDTTLIRDKIEEVIKIYNEINDEIVSIKLYKDEFDIIQSAIEICKQRTEDNIIEQLNNL